MANLYGVSNPVLLPAVYFQPAFGNIACPAGAETNVISSPALVALSNGYFYPWVAFSWCILLGATPPTALVVGARIGAGSDFAQMNISPALLVANATLQGMGILSGTASAAAWQGAGSVVNATVNPTGQAVTSMGAIAEALFTLYRAPDQ